MGPRLGLVFAAVLLAWSPAVAAQKVAVFPFEIDYQPSEEDFYIGEKKVSPEEQARLKLVHKTFVEQLTASGKYEAVDLVSFDAEITAAQPLYNCNDCDIDIAKKAGAELSISTVLDKVSETHLNMLMTMRNAATGAVVRNLQVVIQGNTDDTWLHGARWLLKNRILVEGKTP